MQYIRGWRISIIIPIEIPRRQLHELIDITFNARKNITITFINHLYYVCNTFFVLKQITVRKIFRQSKIILSWPHHMSLTWILRVVKLTNEKSSTSSQRSFVSFLHINCYINFYFFSSAYACLIWFNLFGKYLYFADLGSLLRSNCRYDKSCTSV